MQTPSSNPPGDCAPLADVAAVLLEQLDAGLRAVDVKLDQAALRRLDDIFPGYRTAPEDYAW